MIGILRKIFGRTNRTKEKAPSPRSEKDDIFDDILVVSERIHRAERLKQFGIDNDIDVGVSGSDSYIDIQNKLHDDLMKRYRKLVDEEVVE